MKKLLSIIVLGLLWCNASYAKEKAGHVYYKDDTTIHIKSHLVGNKDKRAAIAHCASLGKFFFLFWGDSKHGVNKSQIWHCSKNNLTYSPTSGGKVIITNYDANHEFAKEVKEAKKKESIEQYKTTCASLGFEWGTDKFADCTLKLMLSDKKNKETTNQTTTSSETKIDWGKVAEEFNPELKDKNKRKCVKHGNTEIICEDVD